MKKISATIAAAAVVVGLAAGIAGGSTPSHRPAPVVVHRHPVIEVVTPTTTTTPAAPVEAAPAPAPVAPPTTTPAAPVAPPTTTPAAPAPTTTTTTEPYSSQGCYVTSGQQEDYAGPCDSAASVASQIPGSTDIPSPEAG